jgi:acetyl esterase/lipase
VVVHHRPRRDHPRTLRASLERLKDLPPALIATGEADVLRDEGEAYATKLHQAGVPVTTTRYQGVYQGVIHDTYA